MCMADAPAVQSPLTMPPPTARRAPAKPRQGTPRRAAQALQAGSLAQALDQLIARRDFDIHFQAIVDSTQGQVLGYEALTRPPADSPLASPWTLFQTAAEFGRLVELERLVVRRIVERFVALKLPGRVFINVSADTLIAARHRQALIVRELARHALPPSTVVVELTEARAVHDEAALASVVASLRAAGLHFALDDLGQGFASLKRWIDLRPDFVKIDRHFVDGIAGDPMRRQFVRSILEMAEGSGAAVIAEGLEREADWHTLRELGARLFQGYLIARPSATPEACAFGPCP